jgi:hypothetical protein
MRVHYHRKRGWGSAGVVSKGTCRADLWLGLQCREGYLDPDRAGRMDHHLFRIGYLYLDKRFGAPSMSTAAHGAKVATCDDLKTYGPRTDRPFPEVPLPLHVTLHPSVLGSCAQALLMVQFQGLVVKSGRGHCGSVTSTTGICTRPSIVGHRPDDSLVGARY